MASSPDPSTPVTQEGNKRSRGTPTFLTPLRPAKRQSLRGVVPTEHEGVGVCGRGPRARLSLSFKSGPSGHISWSEEELKGLVEFVLLMCDGEKWPTHHIMNFWRSAGEFVQQRTSTRHIRSDRACRFKVVGSLMKKFKSPLLAEKSLLEVAHTEASSEGDHSHVRSVCTQTEVVEVADAQTEVDEVVNEVLISENPSIAQVSHLFSTMALKEMAIVIPEDFFSYSARAMKILETSGRSNVVYKLAKGIGTLREDGVESCFPTKRMPMGLLEYMVDFYSSRHLNSVMSCPKDYRLWQQTMFAHFGQKWAKLHHGPLWSVEAYGNSSSKHQRTIDKARVNVPGLTERTLQRDFQSSGISLTPAIQLHVLDEAAASHPDSWWWVKADGVDVVSGLGESLRMEWSGDIDLNDGKLQQQYTTYKNDLLFIEGLGCTDKKKLQDGLHSLSANLIKDLEFITTNLKAKTSEFEERVRSKTAQEKAKLGLSWDLKELEFMNENGRQLYVELQTLADQLIDDSFNMQQNNVAKKLADIKDGVISLIKSLSRHKRVAATHALVVMISPEERCRKPYALPVQCVPYKGLPDNTVRRLINKVIKEMVQRGMKVAGCTTNGEWNTLRTMGNSRPTSVFQVRADIRSKYSRLGVRKMMAMLTPIRNVDGTVSSMIPVPHVSSSLLEEILSWKEEQCSEEDIICRLRLRTVPQGYKPNTWIEGKEEELPDKLRSILAQLEFANRIRAWEEQGVPFRTHLYVPEVHPITGSEFCEREDEGHVFKRIGHSLRLGGSRGMKLERFVEAMKDPSTQLTYAALTGKRTQSVEDVERLFSSKVISFMERKNYHDEAKYLQVIRNWRRAVDERGLSDDQRHEFNVDLLKFILDELMPWHEKELDFSLLEVNRSVSNVRGFTREVLIALAANIETREWRRTSNKANGIPPEHPRSSTTDDVECFFSVLRDNVGKNFTMKQVFYGWRKVTAEFLKRLDPELPFYYHTSTDRFYEGPMSSFDKPRETVTELRRPPRRELMYSQDGRRISYATRGSGSIRATYHAGPTELPPVPMSFSVFRDEHSYSRHHDGSSC